MPEAFMSSATALEGLMFSQFLLLKEWVYVTFPLWKDRLQLCIRVSTVQIIFYGSIVNQSRASFGVFLVYRALIYIISFDIVKGTL